MVETWNWNFTSSGRSSSKSRSYVRLPSTVVSSNSSLCRPCWMPAALACSPILLYSSAARLTSSMVGWGGPSRLGTIIWVSPTSLAQAIRPAWSFRSSSMLKCELTQLKPTSLSMARSSAGLYLARPAKPESEYPTGEHNSMASKPAVLSCWRAPGKSLAIRSLTDQVWHPMGRSSGLVKNSLAPSENSPANAACCATVSQNCLLESAVMAPPTSLGGPADGYSSHPARRSGRMYLSAAPALTTWSLGRSQMSRCPSIVATLPSSRVSVTMLENSKLPPGLTVPPLQASSHSRSLPGVRGSVLGGGWNASILACGISLGPRPLNPQRIFPLSPMNSSPSSSSPSPLKGRSSSSSAGRAGLRPPSYQVKVTGGISPRAANW